MYLIQTNSEVKYLFIASKMLSNVVYLVCAYVAKASLCEAELIVVSFFWSVDKSNSGQTFLIIKTLRLGNDKWR
jgi:hypothetical protein